MKLLPFFGKFKSLTPLWIVGGAVLITIKLLTTATPIEQEELKVNAEEDISLVSFEDEIVIPPPPKAEEPPAEEKKEELEETQDGEAEEGEEETENSESDGQKAEEEQKQQKKEENQQKARKWNDNNPFAKTLSKLLGAGKKK